MKSIALIVSLLVFLSCKTLEFPPTIEEGQIKELADIQLTLTLLTREDLHLRHGMDAHFFYDYPGLIPKKRVVVFQLEGVSEESDMSFHLAQVYIRSQNHDFAQTREGYLAHWERFLVDETQVRNHQMLLNRCIFRDWVHLSPGNPIQGYLVFLTADRRSTQWELVIPGRTEEGDRGNIVFPFELESLAEEDLEENNQGIFIQ